MAKAQDEERVAEIDALLAAGVTFLNEDGNQVTIDPASLRKERATILRRLNNAAAKRGTHRKQSRFGTIRFEGN